MRRSCCTLRPCALMLVGLCPELGPGDFKCYRVPSAASPIPTTMRQRIRQGTVEVTVAGRGQFTAQLIRIDLHRLWMQRFSEHLARIKHTNGLGGRAVIAFPTQLGANRSWNGVELQPTRVIRHMAGGSYYQCATGATSYGAMSLPLADLGSVRGMLGAVTDALILTSWPSAMAKLQRLHAAAGHLAETAPEVIAHPEAARGLEQGARHSDGGVSHFG